MQPDTGEPASTKRPSLGWRVDYPDSGYVKRDARQPNIATRTTHRVTRISVATFAIILACAVAVIAALIVLPKYVVMWDVNGPLTTVEFARAVADARGTLLQAIGGTSLVVGAVFAWRQLQVTRESQMTERFTRAIDQLGNDKTEVRIGGIYGLERLGVDSPPSRESVTEILTSYVRSRASWPPNGLEEGDVPSYTTLRRLRDRAPDVQAAITVLGRRPVNYEGKPLALFEVDLRGADLRHLRLGAADFRGAHFEAANLRNARLKDAFFRHACLTAATLEGADFTGADLDDTDLSGAIANADTIWPKNFDPYEAGVTMT